MLKRLTAAAILVALTGTASAQDLLGGTTAQEVIAEFEATASGPKAFEMPKLNIGDEPPAFKVDSWVKGTPISSFEEGNVYLIDFWATWCGPCIAIMPHLTELQKEHEADGLRVVGVSIWESERDADGNRVPLRGEKQADHVQAFVDKNDARMGYTVGTGSEFMETDWMRAANQNGIPTVMIVDRQGKIGWIGYGTDPTLGENLDAILAGENDYAADSEARLEEMKSEWEESISRQKESGQLYYNHFLGLAKSDKDQAAAFAQAMSETVVKDKPNVYNAIAWTIVENEGWSPDAVGFARQLAEQACELTDWENPMVMDTLAWAQYRSGDAEAATQTEQKALDMLTEEQAAQVKSDFEKALELFKQG